ncbi:MAG: hypothetical protein R3A48_20715 [Polyangiales bacterium]
MVMAAQGNTRNEIRVCPNCGAVAPTGLAQCGACGEALGLRGLPSACALPGRPWARVEVVLPCPRCSSAMHPRPEAIDGAVTCPRCNESSSIDVSTWDEVIQLAHAVVDLSFPDLLGQNAPLGAWNPFGEVGATQSCIDLPSERVTPQSRVALRVGPGAPLCPRCRAVLSVHFLHNGRQTTECPSCGDREAFALPQGLASRAPALRALLGFSPHAASASGRVEPWWVLLDGPSTMREVVIAQRAEAERAEAERAQWQAWELQERERKEREAQLEAASARRAQEERERKAREARAAAESARMGQELQQANARAEALEASLNEARARVEQLTAQSLDARASAESQRLAAAQELERVRQEGAYHLDQARLSMAQRDASWQAQESKLREEMAAQSKRFKLRWGIAIALWLLVAIGVAADLALAFGR